ncbi:hypothetical protein EK904_010151, partial [Melospiza melodia maxima]
TKIDGFSPRGVHFSLIFFEVSDKGSACRSGGSTRSVTALGNHHVLHQTHEGDSSPVYSLQYEMMKKVHPSPALRCRSGSITPVKLLLSASDSQIFSTKNTEK